MSLINNQFKFGSLLNDVEILKKKVNNINTLPGSLSITGTLGIGGVERLNGCLAITGALDVSGVTKYQGTSAITGALDLTGSLSLTKITAPSLTTNRGKLYTRDYDGFTELFYLDNTGQETRLTRDGYVYGLADTRLPCMTYSTSSVVTVAAQSGQSSTVRITLQDGKIRTFTGTLTWSFANGAADLGLDTGAEAASTWYYMYLVPSGADDNVLTVRASITSPATGPTGYTNFKYIGAFRNNASSNIIPFYHKGDTFNYAYIIDTGVAAGGTDANPVQLSLANYVPVTCDKVYLHNKIQANNASNTQVYFWVTGQHTFGTNYMWFGSWGSTSYVGTYNSVLMPTPGAAKEIYYQRTENAPLVCKVWVTGWIDSYL